MKRTGLILSISGFWSALGVVSGFYTNTYAQEETLTLLTYYPAPYGVYQQLEVLRQDGSYSNIMISQYNDATIYPMITFRKARGTLASPTAILDNYRLGTIVFGGHDGTSFQNGAEIYAIADADWGASQRGTELLFLTRDDNQALLDRMIIKANGRVGIGTDPAGSALLQVGGQAGLFSCSIYGYSDATSGVIGRSNTFTGVGGMSASGNAVSGTSISGAGVRGVSTSSYGIHGITSNWSSYAGYFEGRIGTSSSHPGDTTKHLYDIAELIPCGSDVEYGDVVVINPEKDREAIRCTNENQSAAGIISENPQLSFGDREKAREEAPEKNWNFLALAGQVYVKVDASFGEIKRGDLLSVSSIPGHAMKARPIGEINGHPIYPQGCIVGKALEPLKEGRGKIQALACLM